MISKQRSYVTSIAFLFLLSCAAQSVNDHAWQLYKDGNYSEAIVYADQVIQNPQDDRELYHSYYIRAESNMAEGFPEKAFHDYYAAKIVSCYLERNKTPSKRYGTGMVTSSYCYKWSDEKMASAAATISADRTAELKRDVERSLARYLE